MEVELVVHGSTPLRSGLLTGGVSTDPAARELECEWLGDCLLQLCSADTTTGSEARGHVPLRRLLADLGAEVFEQPVEGARTNVLATWGRPRVLFTTHLDTVPPYLPPRIENGTIRGRGTCDAKGQIVAQLGAVQRLLRDGVDQVAWLGVVAEETDSAGARAAAAGLSSRLGDCEAVINGEPTRLKLANGQRGAVHVRLSCTGKAAHSGVAHLGINAIWPLAAWLGRIRELPRVTDPDLGDETWNLACFVAGDALNVVPDHARADILARTVRDSTLLADISRLAPENGSAETISATVPSLFPAIPGFEREPVPFGSDAPRLASLARGGTVVMAGPGDIDCAHTEHEHLTLSDLLAGVHLNQRLALHFLAGAHGAPTGSETRSIE